MAKEDIAFKKGWEIIRSCKNSTQIRNAYNWIWLYKKMYGESELTIFAWGNNQKTPKWIEKIVKNPHYIKLSKKGIPMHPLYLKKNLYPKSILV